MPETERTLVLICTICLILNGECIQIVESVHNDTYTKLNTTTLYPVDKNVFIKSTTEQTNVDVTRRNTHNADVTVWKINTTFANVKDDVDDEDSIENTNDLITTNKTSDDCKGLRRAEKEFKSNAFVFPNDTTNTSGNKLKFVNQDVTENLKQAKENVNEAVFHKEFKPSPHLNSYYDTIDDSPLHHHHSEAYASLIQTPTFFGSRNHKFEQHPVKPPEGFAAFPYKYETKAPTHSVAEWSAYGLQSRPTVEAPVRIPAGGLYKQSDVLKDNPNLYSVDDDYNQGPVDNVKENPLKKRANPWRKLLHLATALLPVGLIVSALTPSVITIQNQELGSQHHKRLSRRLDDTTSFPVVSEECKRRLLCEIHSDRNYPSNGTPHPRPKRCYKIHCEDPHSVNRALRWLLAYHRTGDTRARGYT